MIWTFLVVAVIEAVLSSGYYALNIEVRKRGKRIDLAAAVLTAAIPAMIIALALPFNKTLPPGTPMPPLRTICFLIAVLLFASDVAVTLFVIYRFTVSKVKQDVFSKTLIYIALSFIFIILLIVQFLLLLVLMFAALLMFIGGPSL